MITDIWFLDEPIIPGVHIKKKDLKKGSIFMIGKTH